MNILDKIIEHKKREIADRKKNFSIREFEVSGLSSRKTLSLKDFLLDETKTGIIAEFKRKSPSKGIINENADVVEVTSAYAKYGASGISVLTDQFFFGGSASDFQAARENPVPLLRKDFIIDEFQVAESRYFGADVVLLIASCLTPGEVKQLANCARSLAMEVLLEIHDESELGHICDDTKLVGVNNRNLKTFEVDIEQSLRMAEKIPTGKIKIAESGIKNVESLLMFRENGFKGFLIGENFMKSSNPAIAFATFVNQLKSSGQSAERKQQEGRHEN